MHPIKVEDRLSFIRAGNARFTLRSSRTGNRYTYRVKASRDGRVLFASVLTGPDNTRDYTYLGLVTEGGLRLTRGSRIGAGAPSARALAWFLDHAGSPEVEVYHEGRCGRCARALTTPESVERGIGPECAGMLGL